MRRFVVIGQRATAAPDFHLEDIPGTSGRIDALLRCVRAALLYSHGLRHDSCVYLVLLGGASSPRVARFDGAVARFLRPDERSLALTLRKLLATEVPATGEFVQTRTGLAIARGGLEIVIADVGTATTCVVLDEGGADLRTVSFARGGTNGAARDAVDDITFFLGDHLGFDDATRARLDALGCLRVSVGPVSLHAEDVVTIVVNELDRRGAVR